MLTYNIKDQDILRTSGRELENRYPVSAIRSKLSNFQLSVIIFHSAFCILYLAFCIFYQISAILYPLSTFNCPRIIQCKLVMLTRNIKDQDILRISGRQLENRYPVSGIPYPVSGIWYPVSVSAIRSKLSSFQLSVIIFHSAFCILYSAFCIFYQISAIPCPLSAFNCSRIIYCKLVMLTSIIMLSNIFYKT